MHADKGGSTVGKAVRLYGPRGKLMVMLLIKIHTALWGL